MHHSGRELARRPARFDNTDQRLQRQPEPQFLRDWNVWRDMGEGQSFGGAYNVHKPTRGTAYFHILLDASGSTRRRCRGEENMEVWEQLLEHFKELVSDTLLPDDVVHIWSFNTVTTPLRAFKAKRLNSEFDLIRQRYRKALKARGHTGLYDAVVEALRFQIEEDRHRSADADCFLVPFTDGIDNSSKASLQTLMNQIDLARINRLHIMFVTANLPRNSELNWTLQMRKVKALIRIETSTSEDMSEAFRDLRRKIKAILTVRVSLDHGNNVITTRVAEYGSSVQEAGRNVRQTVYDSDVLRQALQQLQLR